LFLKDFSRSQVVTFTYTAKVVDISEAMLNRPKDVVTSTTGHLEEVLYSANKNLSNIL